MGGDGKYTVLIPTRTDKVRLSVGAYEQAHWYQIEKNAKTFV